MFEQPRVATARPPPRSASSCPTPSRPPSGPPGVARTLGGHAAPTIAAGGVDRSDSGVASLHWDGVTGWTGLRPKEVSSADRLKTAEGRRNHAFAGQAPPKRHIEPFESGRGGQPRGRPLSMRDRSDRTRRLDDVRQAQAVHTAHFTASWVSRRIYAVTMDSWAHTAMSLQSPSKNR